jgi:hypothetical protein
LLFAPWLVDYMHMYSSACEKFENYVSSWADVASLRSLVAKAALVKEPTDENP